MPHAQQLPSTTRCFSMVCRRVLQSLSRALLLCGLTCTALAAAPDYPARPVKLVVPYPTGGTIDPLARLLADALARALGQNFVVENRPGANGNIGTASVVRADPDGYTLALCSSGTLATNVSLYRSMQFNPQKDLLTISLYASVPNILVVHPSLPVHTLAEFTAYAKSAPGTLNYGSTGNGSSMQLAAELFKALTATQLTHVPYTSATQATQDLLTGRTQLMFQLVTGIAPFVKSGQVRAIVVAAPRRSAVLPNVPTTAEAGLPGFESSAWYALVAPAGTPRAVTDRLNNEVNRLLADPEFRARLAAMGAEPMGGSGDAAAAYLEQETRKWAEVVRQSGAKID
jgi:tripartite-type tricarboxylate transporter receptor subunit TctC